MKERNHECEQCGKKFFLRDDLRTHARIHTGLKPYSCNICGKTFKHISHRNRHQNTNHTGITLYLFDRIDKIMYFSTHPNTEDIFKAILISYQKSSGKQAFHQSINTITIMKYDSYRLSKK